MEVYLRAFESEDYLLISEWRKEPELWTMTTGNVVFVSSEREKKWVENKMMNDVSDLYCAICLTENSKMIGYVSLNHIDHKNKNAMLGVIIGDKNYRAMNHPVQAMYLMMKHGFEQLGLHKIEGEWFEEHQTARFLSKTLGFKEEGVLREHIYKNGKFNNMVVGSVLVDEFLKLKDQIKFDN